MLGGLFTQAPVFFLCWREVVMEGLWCILHIVQHRGCWWAEREELRISKCRGTVHLPGHWPVTFLPSNTSIVMFLQLPQLPYSELQTSVSLVLQPPETVPYKTSVSPLSCGVLWMASPVSQGRVWLFWNESVPKYLSRFIKEMPVHLQAHSCCAFLNSYIFVVIIIFLRLIQMHQWKTMGSKGDKSNDQALSHTWSSFSASEIQASPLSVDTVIPTVYTLCTNLCIS